MPIWVYSEAEMGRIRLLRVMVLKALRESKPCPTCKGAGHDHHAPPFHHVWVVCSTCKGLAFDLSILPDKGILYGHFGMKKDLPDDIYFPCPECGEPGEYFDSTRDAEGVENMEYRCTKCGHWFWNPKPVDAKLRRLSEDLNEDLHESRMRQRFRDAVDRLERNRRKGGLRSTLITKDRKGQ